MPDFSTPSEALVRYDQRSGLALPAELPEVRIPGFEILGVLGHGGMGVVYKARQLNLDRLIALKLISEQYLSNDIAIKRFEREAQAAARLTHPNIVTIYQAGSIGNIHFLAMEYVAGNTLHYLVDQSGYLSITKACEYTRQAALGLHHAHSRGLVHRDVKPANLMGTQGGAVKILDMGRARIAPLEGELHPGHMTHHGVFMGTPDFVAPEQANDARTADGRADLYSLGVTFFYLLTGELPFVGATSAEKLDKHRYEPPPNVQAHRPEVPSEVAQILYRMLAKRPEDRYQTGAELAAALAPYCPRDSAILEIEELSLSIDMPTHENRQSTADGIPTGAAAELHSPRDGERRTLAVGSMPSMEFGILEWPPELLAAELGECLAWRSRQNGVQALQFLPDGHRVITAGRDGSLRIWDAATGEELHSWAGSEVAIVCMAVASDGLTVLTGDETNTLRVWSLADSKQRLVMPALTSKLTCVAVTSDGLYGLTGTGDGVLRLWDLQTGHRLRRFEGHREEITCATLSRDGACILSGSRDQTLRLWETSTGRELRAVDDLGAGHRRAIITTVAVSAASNRFITAGTDHNVCFWNATNGKLINKFSNHRGWVYQAIFTPNERRLLSCSGDKTVRLWDLLKERELVCFTGHTARITSLACSPDGLFAVSAGMDALIRLWRLPA
ncbi:MAG TPA: serine/threonine-protein kinase [Gemmatales bacterium]|nr:serine/threonine-protein kinase [Gemmatales bacterium]